MACCMPPARRCRACCNRCLATTPISSGLVMSPSGIGSIAMLLVVGVLLGRGVDARWMIAAGLIVCTVANYWMSQTNLEISPWQVDLAAGDADRGIGNAVRAGQRGRLHVHAPGICAGRRWGCSACCATKGGAWARRWPRRSRSGATSFTRCASNEFLDPLNPDVAVRFSPRPRPSSSSKRAIRPLRNRWPCRRWTISRAAGLVAGLFRHLRGRRGGAAGPGPAGLLHEALGGRKGRPRGSRIGRRGRGVYSTVPPAVYSTVPVPSIRQCLLPSIRRCLLPSIRRCPWRRAAAGGRNPTGRRSAAARCRPGSNRACRASG